MTAAEKPVIRLEINAGEFKIPTENAIYHIIVQAGAASSGVRVVEKIVEQEKQVVAPPAPETAEDTYYKAVSEGVYKDIGNLARSLSATIMELPAEDLRKKRANLDEAGEKLEDAKSQLKDIVEMTERATMEIMDHVEKVQGQTHGVKELLSFLKNHAAFQVPEQTTPAAEAGSAGEMEKIRGMIERAQEIVSVIRPAGEAEVRAEAPKGRKKQFLFSLDAVFQTFYELCTNEAVKTHVTNVRKQAATAFTADTFLEQLNLKVAGLENEEGFFNVPMQDVFASLVASCTDKGIKNLLQKMDTNKATLFLDQILPLEVPSTREVEVELPAAPVSAPPPALASQELDELGELLGKILASTVELNNASGSGVCVNQSAMTVRDQKEIFSKIEAAFQIASEISLDVSKITETLSFQDLSGQQILKIIKLLGDFQIQLLALIVSFGSQLKHKKENAAISVEEGKRLAQDDVDSYLNKIYASDEKDRVELDQESVNQLLENMGF